MPFYSSGATGSFRRRVDLSFEFVVWFGYTEKQQIMNARTVIFPEILGHAAKLNATRLTGRGYTTREVVLDICEKYPVLRSHLFYANGHFKDHFLVTAAGTLVDLDARLESRDEIEIMLATSGGRCQWADQCRGAALRSSHHLAGVGREGQARLKKARVLIIGTGGLGSPISLYLAAAGIGTIGLADFDTVEVSNLQRQVVHGYQTIGAPKVESAKRRLLDLNPHIDIRTHAYAVDKTNAHALIEQYDVVIDGTDNFASRYVVNEACARRAKPLIYGALYRFDGQLSVFNLAGGPCYRCLFPKSPPPELAPSCNAGGVIGVLRRYRAPAGNGGDQTDHGLGQAALRKAVAFRCARHGILGSGVRAAR